MSYRQLRSRGSTRLPTTIWPWFRSRRRHHTRGLIEFIVGSILAPISGFVSGYSGFPLSTKTNNSKFQFVQKPGRRRTTMWMLLPLIRHVFIYPSTTDSHRFLINGRCEKTSSLAVLQRFDCKQSFHKLI